MKSFITSALLLLCFSVATLAQITVSEYTRALKVDAHNVPSPDVEFTSTCGKVNVEISEKMASGGCLGTLIRTYNATDECGNSAMAEQYLSLQDNTGPELIGVPADITVEKESDIPEAPVVSAQDLGDRAIKVTLSLTKKDDKLIRTWYAEDKCGNKSEASQTITIKEIQAKK